MRISELKKAVADNKFEDQMIMLYGPARYEAQKTRYAGILDRAEKLYGDQEASLFSAPGRTEVGGNHTDHQLGRVLAASIDLDVAAVAIRTDDNVIVYDSDKFHVRPVDISSVEIVKEEKNTTESLIRGIAGGFIRQGLNAGGFKCYAESDVLPGSGMSSSAAFEILIAEILNVFYNRSTVSPVLQAQIGQYAENVYFGKASGLMDQTACSVGGFITIDFADKEHPDVRKVPFDFDASGFDLILTDCRQSHADLSDEYSLIPIEMLEVAGFFNKEVLSQITLSDLLEHASEVRKVCPDRAFMRAYHFLKETERVRDEVSCLESGDMKGFLNKVIESGYSSYMYLQNVYPPGDALHQSLAVGLAISEEMLKDKGAWRVHGGGFAGTIQAFVPHEISEEYVREMENVFGENSCYVLRIRSAGGYLIG